MSSPLSSGGGAQRTPRRLRTSGTARTRGSGGSGASSHEPSTSPNRHWLEAARSRPTSTFDRVTSGQAGVTLRDGSSDDASERKGLLSAADGCSSLRASVRGAVGNEI